MYTYQVDKYASRIVNWLWESTHVCNGDYVNDRPQEGLSGMCNRTKTILLTSCQRVDISKRTRARGVHVTRKFVARCGETSVWSTGGAVVNRKLPRVDTKQRARDVSIVIADARCRSVSATCLQTKMSGSVEK